MQIQDIVPALQTNRTEFAYLFLRAQSSTDAGNRVEFESIDPDAADNNSAFTTALTYAEQKGFIKSLLKLIADSNLETGDIAKAVLEEMAKDGHAGLEAITHRGAGFTNPLKKATGLINGSRWTGKVVINNQSMGTGILIGPNLFLTAWHVVKDLFDPVISGGVVINYTPRQYTTPPGCPLTIQFDDTVTMNGGYQMPKNVNAHQNWYVTHSTCHPDELNDIIPHPKSALTGYWDYAIIRLEVACGFERRWVNLDKRSIVPQGNSDIIVFQHPAGLDLKMDERQIKDLLPADPAIPGMRFLHTVNSLNGSSGGPCFDKDFYLIGIHQGKWPDKIDNSDINRAIPITNIIADFQTKVTTLPVPAPEDCPIFKTDEQEIVIGCDRFVLVIWQMALHNQTRILRIQGQKKTGKTFMVNVFRTLLPSTDHLKIILDFEEIRNLNTIGLVKTICSSAGIPEPAIDTLENYNTPQPAWLRAEVLPKLMSSLDNGRSDRMVWIVFTNMNDFDLLDKGISDFLFLLYEQVQINTWLRFILDGMAVDLTPKIRGSAETFITQAITVDDIENCLRRMLSEINRVIDNATIIALAEFLFEQHHTALNTNQTTALSSLAASTKLMVIKLQKTSMR